MWNILGSSLINCPVGYLFSAFLFEGSRLTFEQCALKSWLARQTLYNNCQFVERYYTVWQNLLGSSIVVTTLCDKNILGCSTGMWSICNKFLQRNSLPICWHSVAIVNKTRQRNSLFDGECSTWGNGGKTGYNTWLWALFFLSSQRSLIFHRNYLHMRAGRTRFNQLQCMGLQEDQGQCSTFSVSFQFSPRFQAISKIAVSDFPTFCWFLRDKFM